MNNQQPTTNNEQPTTSGFTLIELMVAIGLLAIVLSFAGVIFNASIKTYRTAIANAEIMRKLRAIVDQLDNDFQGLCKDGEIFVTWVAKQADTATAAYDGYHDCDDDGYERFDRIMFFATGDFQSYNAVPIVRGNLARICYTLARDAGGRRAGEYKDMSLTAEGRRLRQEDRRNRILARTQHILVPREPTDDYNVPADWRAWNNLDEYEEISLEEWKHLPIALKQDMLTVISDVNVYSATIDPDVRGAYVDPHYASTIHMLLCEGVGEFKVQGWYNAQDRWVPEVDPDNDGPLIGRTDFYWVGGVLDRHRAPMVLYPYRVPEAYGGVAINGIGYGGPLDETDFNRIPGLGRALKFTFTLFDSKGIIKQGRTFTHIVHLDK